MNIIAALNVGERGIYLLKIKLIIQLLNLALYVKEQIELSSIKK